MSRVFDEHRQYLEDEVRVDAFRAAIAERVRPGDVVVDVGAGTGILGLLACQAGAARVYAIERTGLIEVAKRIAGANGFGSRIVHIRELSPNVELPERADGLVCDQIGHFGFEAGLFEILTDARRFLKPGGWTVPHALDFEVAPIADEDVAERVRFWSRPVASLDFSAVHEWAVNSGYPKHLDAGQLLGPAATIAHVEMSEVSTSRIAGETTLSITREGTLDAIGGWFTASLSPGVRLTNAPGAPARLARRNVVLPLERSIRVAPGDSIELRIQILPANVVLTWRGSVRTAAGVSTFSHSTLAGMLLTRDDLRHSNPDGTPALTPRGRARLTVLQLCDGRRTLAEIERDVLARHPALFRTPDAAAVFVSEVISVYAQ